MRPLHLLEGHLPTTIFIVHRAIWQVRAGGLMSVAELQSPLLLQQTAEARRLVFLQCLSFTPGTPAILLTTYRQNKTLRLQVHSRSRVQPPPTLTSLCFWSLTQLLVAL